MLVDDPNFGELHQALPFLTICKPITLAYHSGHPHRLFIHSIPVQGVNSYSRKLCLGLSICVLLFCLLMGQQLYGQAVCSASYGQRPYLIKSKNQASLVCSCGSSHTNCHLAKHLSSLFHTRVDLLTEPRKPDPRLGALCEPFHLVVSSG